jgi:GT2 family glycosyltransferase
MKPAPVSIVIVTWNAFAYTRQCLESLRELTDHPDYEIIVSDNGSIDGTLDYLRQLHDIRLIENGRNLGFVAGNNAALETIEANRDVLLLNADTEVQDPNWLQNLQSTAYSRDDIGLVGCRLRFPDGRLQHVGSYMPKASFRGQLVGGNEKDIHQYPADQEVDSVIFACVYIKRALLDAIGPLDDDYFSYFEDTDYCYKAKLAGFKTYYCSSVAITHHHNTSTRENGVSMWGMYHASREIFKEKWQQHLLEEQYSMEVSWRSSLNFPSGYSRSSRAFVSGLERRGIAVRYAYLYGQNTPVPVDEKWFQDDHELAHVSQRPIDPSKTQVVYGLGNCFQNNSGAYKIGFSMLETDRIPAEWVRQANLMDEVWVPCQFNVESFRTSGVARPIHLMPLGVDPNYFHPNIAGWKEPEIYSFLSIFEWGERKAPETLLRAFTDEFSANEDVVLFCKVINTDRSLNVEHEIRKLNLARGGGRIVISLNQVLSDSQLGALYRSVDCYVSPTRGEGFGMTVLEAMACGLPVIATNWSGYTDFFNGGNGYPVDYQMIPAEARCPYYAGFRWADPSYEHLRAQMRRVFENRREAEEKGRIASSEVLQWWTWDKSVMRMVDRLEAIDLESSQTGANT